jgi:HEAT repeat protein
MTLAALWLFVLAQSGPQETPETIRGLVEKLRSERIEERDEAMRSLRRLGAAAVPHLEKAAGDKDTEVAGRARQILRILEALRHLTPNLLKAFPGAEDRLAAGGPHSWTELLTQAAARLNKDLKSDDLEPLIPSAFQEVRTPGELSAFANAVAGAHKSALTEVAKLLSHPEAEMRKAAIVVLGDYSFRPAVGPMIPLLSDPDSGVRSHAALRLAHLGAREAVHGIVRLLKDAEEEVCWAAVAALAELEERETWPRLLEVLRDGARSGGLRGAAATTLARFGVREAVPDVERLLASAEPAGRCAAAVALAHLGARESIPGIVRLLEDKDFDVQRQAMAAVRMLGAKEGIPPLMKILESGKEELRAPAIRALRRLRAREAAGLLARRLKEGDEATREAAAETLGWLGLRDAVPGLVEILKEETAGENILAQAARSLGRLGATEAAPELLKWVRDTSRPETVRAACVDALAAMDARDTAGTLLGRIKDPGEAIRVRGRAILGLGTLRAGEAKPALVELVQGEKENVWVRDAALSALQDLGASDAAARLLPLLGSPSEQFPTRVALTLARLGVRIDAEEIVRLIEKDKPWFGGEVGDALAVMGGERAIPHVVKLLGHENEDVRLSSAQALCRLGRRDGVPLLLREAENEGRGLSLAVLNALRRPEIWKHLRDRPCPRGWGVTEAVPPDLWELLEEITGMKVSTTEILRPPNSPGTGATFTLQEPLEFEPEPGTALRALVWGDGESDREFILEEGTIRILSRAKALEFWKGWWAAEGRK